LHQNKAARPRKENPPAQAFFFQLCYNLINEEVPMIAVRAYFDGNYFIPIGSRKFKRNQEALIVVDEQPDFDKKSSSRGLASEYANPALIPKESEVASEAFSGTLK